MIWGPEMQVHGALEIFALHVLERADFDDARVVDHHVETAEVIDDSLHGVVDLRGIEQIARDGDYFSVATDQLFTRPRQFVLIAGEQSDARAFRAKLAREHQTETARTTGDENDFVCEGTVAAGGARNDAAREREPAESKEERALHRI